MVGRQPAEREASRLAWPGQDLAGAILLGGMWDAAFGERPTTRVGSTARELAHEAHGWVWLLSHPLGVPEAIR